MTTEHHAASHTEECVRSKRAWDEWSSRWPHACGYCHGYGGHYMAGDYFTPPSTDPCSCVAEGICARCSDPVDLDDESDVSRCPSCGWTDDPATRTPDMFSPEWECFCEQREEWLRANPVLS